MTNLNSTLKSRDITLPTKVHLIKALVFPVSCMDVRVGLKESWELKNRCFWTVVLEKTLQSPMNCKEIQPVHPKGDHSWIFTGRTDAEAETAILWPPDVKNWLIWKDPDTGKGWGQEEKGTTEDEMVGWHHWLNGHGFGWTLGVGDGQGGLVCCGSWGHKESDTTERLNWTEDAWSALLECFSTSPTICPKMPSDIYDPITSLTSLTQLATSLQISSQNARKWTKGASEKQLLQPHSCQCYDSYTHLTNPP